MTQPQITHGLILKVLLISHGFLFFTGNSKISGYVLLSCFILLLVPRFSLKLDFYLEYIVRKMGNLVLRVALTIFYFTIIFPLSLFRRKEVSKNSSFISINKKTVDFKRPW